MSKKNEFLSLISASKAEELIIENFIYDPIKEEIELEKALTRTLAKNIESKIDVPPFDRSRMDGYAVKASNTYEIDEINPKRFKVIDTIAAGDISRKILEEDFTCIEIATGAPIPTGSNAIVMIEHTSKISDNIIEIFRAVTPQENIELAGSDVMFGETVLYEKDELTPIRLGILASMGISKVPVYRKLKIGVVSSGNELTKIGTNLEYGNIYDSNSIILRNLINELGAESTDFGIVNDAIDEYLRLLDNILPKIDLLLISGGTSAGEGDYSYRAITEKGGKLLFHGVSLKPGKPVAAGLINKKLIIILPGFPGSTIFSFQKLVSPLINFAQNKPKKLAKSIKGKLGQKIRNTSGRTEFKLCYVLKDINNYIIYPIIATSGSITALEKADGYITIPSSVTILEENEEVELVLFKDETKISDLVFVGSHDFRLNKLINVIRDEFPLLNIKLIYSGSTGGLIAMSQGRCDISAIHLLDINTGQYNRSFIKEYQIQEKVVLFKGYKRTQGLYIKKGNPKKIKGLDDLLRSDIKFLNRNEGSGTRILLDSLLEIYSKKRNKNFEDLIKEIPGYQSTSSSHSASANSVKRGLTDVSIGIEEYAKQHDLDFIPLQEEEYDFLIKKASLDKPWIEKFRSLISN